MTIVDDLKRARAMLDEAQPALAPVVILSPTMAADLRRMERIRQRIMEAPTRAARWRMGEWAPCFQCGAPTRAVYVDGRHRHMMCVGADLARDRR